MAGSPARRLAVLLAATLAAATFWLPGAAHAAMRPIPYAPCQPDGVAAADTVIADSLRPHLNGRRLGRSVTGYSISCARAIVANVESRALGQRAAVIAVTAAIAESTLHNYTVAVDHDSLGLFQQRPSQGWGLPVQLTDPRHATHAFLNSMLRKHPANGWMTGDIGSICQRVQGSAYPLAYAPEAHDAYLIVARLWGRTAAPAADKPAKKATGPFQRVLMSAGTGWGQTDARHDISAADWNADRRPDLVVVQRSGTATGRTELFILDGTASVPGVASSFQRLLLRTSTVLGQTNDNYSFELADWNGDGRLDLMTIQRAGTGSGRTEVWILDGATSFQTYLLAVPTALPTTDARHDLSVADANGDGRPDLIAVQKSGTASGKTEVQILDGATNFQTELLRAVTALGPTDRHVLSVTDWNGDARLDLVAAARTGTQVRVLDGAANFQRDLRKTATKLGTLDDRHALSVAEWNGDGRLDLIVVQKSGTTSGRTETRVLAG